MGEVAPAHSGKKPADQSDLYAYAGGRNKYGLKIQEGPVFSVANSGEVMGNKEALLASYKRAEMLMQQVRILNLKSELAGGSLRQKVGKMVADQLNSMVSEKRNMLDPYYMILFYQQIFESYKQFAKFLFFNKEKSFFDLSAEEFMLLRNKIVFVVNFFRFDKKGSQLLFPARFVNNFFENHQDLFNWGENQIRQQLTLALNKLPAGEFKKKTADQKDQDGLELIASKKSPKEGAQKA